MVTVNTRMVRGQELVTDFLGESFRVNPDGFLRVLLRKSQTEREALLPWLCQTIGISKSEILKKLSALNEKEGRGK